MFSDQILQFVCKNSHHLLCYECVVHVLLSLLSRRRGNIDADNITLRLLPRRSCLSPFLPVRVGQLTSLSQPDWWVFPWSEREYVVCCVKADQTMLNIQLDAPTVQWRSVQMWLLTPLMPELCGLWVEGVRSNWGRNTRAKQKRHQKPTGARLSQVAPEAVLLGYQQLMTQVFPDVLLVLSCQPEPLKNLEEKYVSWKKIIVLLEEPHLIPCKRPDTRKSAYISTL